MGSTGIWPALAVKVPPVLLGWQHGRPLTFGASTRPSAWLVGTLAYQTNQPTAQEAQMLTFLVARKKAIIALIGALATWLPLAAADSHISLLEWQALVIAFLGVAGVHEVANVPMPESPMPDLDVPEEQPLPQSRHSVLGSPPI